MRSRALAIALLCLLCVPPSLLAGKKKMSGYREFDGQVSEIKDLHIVTAKQNCESWGWAAAIETMLAYRDVPLKQAYWADKASSGLCPPDLPDYEQLAQLIDDDYFLDDQRKLHLESRFYKGVSATPDFLILSMRQQHPLLLVWKDHPYVLYGVTYDEYIAVNGSRMFIIQKLSLADPLAAKREKRFVTFDRSVDDTDDIGGIMDILVEPPNLQ